MRTIEVMTGIIYHPEQFINRIKKRTKFEYLSCRMVREVYSPCWLFEFRVRLPVSKNADRYAGYYAGVDEINLVPGKLKMIPKAVSKQVEECSVLDDKLEEKRALDMAWSYNRKWINIKYRNLYKPSVLEDYKTHRYYKILYLMEFYNKDRQEKKYMTLDSLTGDLQRVDVV